MNSTIDVLAFWALVVLSIAGTLTVAFFGFGAAAAGTLPAGSDSPERRFSKYGRRALAAVDVAFALGSIGSLLFWSVIATLAALLGTIRSPLLIWVPLLGSAISGGVLVSAAIAQLMRKRHRRLVQLEAIAVPVAAYLANLALYRMLP